MNTNTAYLSFGSNLGDKQSNIERAYKLLEQAGLVIIKKSSFYESAPYGFLEQDFFINTVCEISTQLSAQDLLKTCLETENKLGRVHMFKFGPRIIDIDILLFNNETINDSNLITPHYDMHNRNFMLIPLMEIAGNISLKSLPLSQWIMKCDKLQAITKIVQS